MLKIKWGRFFLILLISGLFYLYETQPLIQPEEKIRKNMLEKFPIGTDKNAVRNYAKRLNRGERYYYSEQNAGWWKDNNQINKEAIGASRIRSSLVNIKFMDITVIWLFDSNNRLIEIYVWRTFDLL